MVFTTYNYCNNLRVAENVRNVLCVPPGLEG